MKLSNDMTDTNFNYLDLKNRQLIFNNYKTDHKYNTIQIPIEPDLKGVIQSYLKHHPQKSKLKNKKHDVHFSVWMDGEPINKSGDITKISNKIFGRNIGSSMLRNIYLTSKYGTMMTDLKKDTTDMGTSVDVAMNTYIKE
jgi:hypothetical protein